MAFRLIVIFMSSFLLLACGGGSKSDRFFRYKLTVKATYAGKKVEGSAVYVKPLARGRTAYPRGEAVVVDLGNERRVYLIMVDTEHRNFHKAIMRTAFEPIFNSGKKHLEYAVYTQALKNLPVGTVRQYNYRELTGPRTPHPRLVAFNREDEPASVFAVDTEKPLSLFGQTFAFEGLYIDKMADKTPVSAQILTHLPWLEPGHEYWRQQNEDGFVGQSLQPATADLLAKDATFGQKLNRRDFRRVR